MDKLKLEVIKFNNKDVIATSVCVHVTQVALHYYVEECNVSTKENKGKFSQYKFNQTTGQFKLYDDGQAIYGELGVESIGWYYYAGGTYHKCEDQDTHPAQAR